MVHIDHEKEARDAYRWFFMALTGALAFVLFLISSDYRLTGSDREHELYKKLRELRMAQTTIGSFTLDERMHHLPPVINSSGDRAPHEVQH